MFVPSYWRAIIISEVKHNQTCLKWNCGLHCKLWRWIRHRWVIFSTLERPKPSLASCLLLCRVRIEFNHYRSIFETMVIYLGLFYNCLVIIPKGSSGVSDSWWRHQMKTFSALLAICAGNSLVIGEFLAQRPVTRSFDVFFDLRLNKPLSKQWWGWWFETPSRPLWRHCNGFELSLNATHRWLSASLQ